MWPSATSAAAPVSSAEDPQTLGGVVDIFTPDAANPAPVSGHKRPRTVATPSVTVPVPQPTVTVPQPTVTVPQPTVTVPQPTVAVPAPAPAVTVPAPAPAAAATTHHAAQTSAPHQTATQTSAPHQSTASTSHPSPIALVGSQLWMGATPSQQSVFAHARIRRGQAFQVTGIPPLTPDVRRTLARRRKRARDCDAPKEQHADLLWRPPPPDVLSADKLDEFLILIRSILESRVMSQEAALYRLMKNDYNVKRTVREIVAVSRLLDMHAHARPKPAPIGTRDDEDDEPTHSASSLHSSDSHSDLSEADAPSHATAAHRTPLFATDDGCSWRRWTTRERAAFEIGFVETRKNFGNISRIYVRTRSTAECVQYYYRDRPRSSQDDLESMSDLESEDDDDLAALRSDALDWASHNVCQHLLSLNHPPDPVPHPGSAAISLNAYAAPHNRDIPTQQQHQQHPQHHQTLASSTEPPSSILSSQGAHTDHWLDVPPSPKRLKALDGVSIPNTPASFDPPPPAFPVLDAPDALPPLSSDFDHIPQTPNPRDACIIC